MQCQMQNVLNSYGTQGLSGLEIRNTLLPLYLYIIPVSHYVGSINTYTGTNELDTSYSFRAVCVTYTVRTQGAPVSNDGRQRVLISQRLFSGRRTVYSESRQWHRRPCPELSNWHSTGKRPRLSTPPQRPRNSAQRLNRSTVLPRQQFRETTP